MGHTTPGGTLAGVRNRHLLALVATGLLAGCATSEPAPAPAPAPASTSSSPAPPAAELAAPAVEPPPAPVPPAPLATSGEPQRAWVTIRALGLERFPVVPYVGTPDDAPGTAIQDAGDLAAPHGSGGLVGPGGLGNFLVTGHRTSSTQPFAGLPDLDAGARVVVETRTHRLVYEITRTRSTSFRRPASLRAQSAAVPGHPDRAPRQAVLTLSTCATQEDHAVGNYWSDEFKNPEHRIDKIGVLRSITPRAR